MSKLVIPEKRQPSLEEVIWSAGFFDGEGCISSSFKKRGTYELRLAISQRDPRPLIEMAVWWGGNIYSHNTGAYVNWQWQLNSSDAILECLETIEPFLRFKKEQAQLGILFLCLRGLGQKGKLGELSSQIKQLKVVS